MNAAEGVEKTILQNLTMSEGTQREHRELGANSGGFSNGSKIDVAIYAVVERKVFHFIKAVPLKLTSLSAPQSHTSSPK